MNKDRSNIVLIGMPGSGKSTVGVLLAKATSRDFVDTDVLIQTSLGRSLQDIVNKDGHMVLRRVEEKMLIGLNCRNHVIATGGSAAYSDPAMTHLKSNGIVVFLDVDLSTLRARIHNYDSRGLAKRPDQSFQELFEERFSLYKKYADIQMSCSKLNQDDVCTEIISNLEKNGWS